MNACGRATPPPEPGDPALHAPPRYRKACEHDAFLPDTLDGLQLSLDGSLVGLIGEAEAQIAALNATSGPALAPLARLLLRTGSIASSKVEGLQVDARTLARAEVATDTGARIGADAAEILANVDAIQHAIEIATAHRKLMPQHLKDIHEVLMARTPIADRAGRFRTTQGWIGGNDHNPCGADFVPAPEDEIRSLMRDLCRFVDRADLSPIVQAAIAHARFGTIHPFDDGNGRTGRALVQVILRRCGLAPTFVPPISVVLAAAKDRYVRGLTRFRRDDHPAAWLEVFAAATSRATDLARGYLVEVGRLQELWRRQLAAAADPRSDAAAWVIIEVLPGFPVVTVSVAVDALEGSGRRRARAAVQLGISSSSMRVSCSRLVPRSGTGRGKRRACWGSCRGSKRGRRRRTAPTG
ncbi:MAG: Fic family protein [Actinomycetota bacterium]